MKRLNLLEGNIKTIYFKYLFPTAIGSLAISIYVLLDTIFIGQGVGADGLAALNINTPIFSAGFGLGLLIGVGGSTLMSMEKGKGNEKRAKEIFTLSMIMAIVVAVIFTVFGVIYEKQLAYLLGATNENIGLVMQYTHWLIRGCGLFVIAMTLQCFLRCDKAPRLVMTSVAVASITNVVLDYIFIFQMNSGIAGGAIATVIAQVFAILVCLTHFLGSSNTLKLSFKKFNIKDIFSIVNIGFPSFCIELSIGVVVLLFNLRLQELGGTIYVSVYGIIANIAIVVIALLNGVGQTLQPIVSVNIGAGKYGRIREIRKISIITAIIIGIVLFLLSQLIPNILISMFTTPTKEIETIGTLGLRIYSISFIIAGINIVNGAYFQA
ncbi:MAG: MATE family efflux transporter, partial [Clostridium perfringens]|nr:MATE family efflux transporter [Clostridium perfringens]